MTKANRPLSPHLSVYRWRVHMFTSIMHRATGMALAGGAILLTWWLVALATGHEYFNTVQSYFASPLGRIILFGMTYALLQHLASGVRHLLMDTGALYELKANKSSANFTYIFALVGTILLWVAAYKILGVL